MATVHEFLNTEPEFGSETYELGLYAQLSPADQAAARDGLVDAVRTQDDSLALTTLAHLADPRAADLARAWVGRRDGQGFWARRALVRLGHGDEAAAGLVADAAGGSKLQRFGALMDLAKIPGDEAFSGLLAGLDDADSLVRLRALDSLVQRFNLKGLELDAAGETNLLSPLRREQTLLGSDLPALHQRSAALLKDWFIALGRGVPADQLGLRYVGTGGHAFREQIGSAVRGETTKIPVDAIRAASEQDRQWAEALLVVNLESEDERIPAALADLDSKWAVDAMTQRLANATGTYEQALKSALRRLQP